MVNPSEERNEIAFFDLETTIPTRPGQGYSILEFGSILVCPKKLVELESYSTLVCPHDLTHISILSVRSNGISRDAVVAASTFSDIADKVFDIPHGRIWAGHNILRFDCCRVKEAFAQINRPPPEPKGTIDSWALLTQKFGRRAGDMKVSVDPIYLAYADIALSFAVGQFGNLFWAWTAKPQESSLPDIYTANHWVSPNATTRNRSNGNTSLDGTGSPLSSRKIEYHPMSSSRNLGVEENHPILSLMTPATGEELLPDVVETSSVQPDTFNMGLVGENLGRETIPSAEAMEEESSTDTISDASSGCNEFLQPDEISIPSITVALVPFYRGSQKIQLRHRNLALQIRCSNLKVQFGLSTKFVDYAGRPRLSFVVDSTPILCGILDACDDLAKRLFMESGGNSEWRPVVARKPGFYNYPTIRLHLPTTMEGDYARWTTEVYQKESASMQRLFFSRYDVAELEALISPGAIVDAYFSLDPYDYQQKAGIRLVGKKLIFYSK